MTGKLTGKVALITGASRGIGRAAALALAKEGAQVVVTARTKADLDTLVKEVKALKTGAKALAVPADLRKEKDVDKLKAKALATFGQVDILVNNAGVGKAGTIATLTTEDYDWMMDTNMRSTWLCTKAFFPAMVERQDGAVIFIGSVAGLMPAGKQVGAGIGRHDSCRSIRGKIHVRGIRPPARLHGLDSRQFRIGLRQSIDGADEGGKLHAISPRAQRQRVEAARIHAFFQQIDQTFSDIDSHALAIASHAIGIFKLVRPGDLHSALAIRRQARWIRLGHGNDGKASSFPVVKSDIADQQPGSTLTRERPHRLPIHVLRSVHPDAATMPAVKSQRIQHRPGIAVIVRPQQVLRTT